MAWLRELIRGEKKEDIKPELIKYFGKRYPEFNHQKIGVLVEELMSCFNQFIIDKCTGYCNANECKNLNLKLIHPNTYTPEENKLYMNVTVKKNKEGKYYYYAKEEDNLERLITLVFNKNYGAKFLCLNQFPIPETQASSHIDLLIEHNNTLDFIELKQWKNPADSPIWAVSECIKNVYLFLHFWHHLYNKYEYSNKIEDYNKFKEKYNIDKITKFRLIILAPKEYFESHNKTKNAALDNAFKDFCLLMQNKIQEDLRAKTGIKKLEIEISVKVLNFTNERFEEIKKIIVKKHIKKYENLDKMDLKAENKGNKTENPIELKNYLNILNNEDIKNLTSWFEE